MNKEALPTDPSIQAPFVPFETLQLRVKADKLHSLWKEFIDLLEITEESDSGNKFRPNYIGSCRALDGQRMNQIIKEAKKEISK
jgi:hypothetical protein